MSDLKTLAVVTVLVSLVVGMTSLFVFHIPAVYCGIITLATGVLFFFIMLLSSYMFVFK
ncbi:hypothetical protein [Methanocella arvoryzae]|uniref:hypothetical protein n=1 Tax=Methanocella arvoryzae TaxID=1175445 RepID=UPI000325BAC4|nr:hypothetical protein [Methanocella arvoryzae]